MIWIKVYRDDAASSEQSQNVLYVSDDLYEQLKTKTRLAFGQKEIAIRVQPLSSIPQRLGAQFHHPAPVRCSQQIIDHLFLQPSAVYQMRCTETTIHVGPVVGFLLGDQHYYYHHRRLKELTDAMGTYEKVGGLYVAFRHCSVNWKERCIYGLYFDYENKRWQYGKLPFPSVVYRRGFNSRNNFVTERAHDANWKVFNAVRFDKWQMYNLLKENATIKPHLPETALLTVDSLLKFMDKYSKVILKPNKLSRGRGISVLTSVGNGTVVVHDYRKYSDFRIPVSQIADYLREGKYLERDYIIQPHLDLARIDGSPWDIRVVMQKNRWHRWELSGVECRLAGAGKLITNISNGGRALALDEAVKLAFGNEADPVRIFDDIAAISMEFCRMMDRTGFHFAEFGLDIAIDNKLRYWFLEANVRPTFKGFKTLDDRIYRRICYEPVFYSASVAGFTWEDNDGTEIQNHS